MVDDGLYARDDGTLVPIVDCTREELLNVVKQHQQHTRVLESHMKLLREGHEKTKNQAYRHAAEIINALVCEPKAKTGRTA